MFNFRSVLCLVARRGSDSAENMCYVLMELPFGAATVSRLAAPEGAPPPLPAADVAALAAFVQTRVVPTAAAAAAAK